MPGMEDKLLGEALEQVRANRAEAEKFAKEPESYLRNKGVDTQKLKFAQTSSGALSDADLEVASGGAMAPVICCLIGGGTTGYACASVGDEPSVT